ncbi:cytochrome c1 [Erythrobacter sp. HL-111]|uniref:cytochrome c1 n=1 Tax=Erythrobacter sp. HL-111 TaxID=1798193 RepID=UPI0006DB4309|nr:cytochrome c1 [Erythrobacter sp. HL-111]KPP95387.1 MAG: ubiquinol-cytochrome c reductase cytochrome c1 subunit PetC [Erythrobacteraceae bacterium HL-111]SDS67995.1 ubiquinol-cytochrome c reductase cytochrome c1 subunit [Erythrobacter sp. HL-111]
MTIRLAGIIVGLVITGILVLWSLLPGVINYSAPEKPDYYAFKEDNIAPAGGFSFEGPLGQWDYAQLQRGYSVYKQVCSSCHSLRYVAFRNLEDIGFSEEEVRAEAASWQVPGIDPQTGEEIMRPAEPTDHFPLPYPNETAARLANNNAYPPDLSLITKARPDGVHYIYSLNLGYVEPDPELVEKTGFETPSGLYFNVYFPSINLAMPQQIYDGLVTYPDGTEASAEQISADVTAFLAWTAEPKMIQRKQTGWVVIGFLLFMTALAFLSYKQVWAGMKPKKK